MTAVPPLPAPATTPGLLGVNKATWGASSITAVIALVASTFVTQAQAPSREAVRAMVAEEMSVHVRSDHALEARSVNELEAKLEEMDEELTTIRKTLEAIKLELALSRAAKPLVPLPTPKGVRPRP